MKPNKYQRETKKLTYYEPPGLWYCPLGLCGGVGELLDAIEFSGRESVLDESGDVLWYLTAMTTSLGLKLSDLIGRNDFKKVEIASCYTNELPIYVGTIAEQVKKCFRDDGGNLSTDRFEIIKRSLSRVLSCLQVISLSEHTTLKYIARRNIEKIRVVRSDGRVTG